MPPTESSSEACASLSRRPRDNLGSRFAGRVRESMSRATTAVATDIVAVDSPILPSDGSGNLLGDSAKARAQLGWIPRTSFADLVAEMVKEDLKEAAVRRSC